MASLPKSWTPLVVCVLVLAGCGSTLLQGPMPMHGQPPPWEPGNEPPPLFDRAGQRKAVYEAVLREYLDDTVQRFVIDPSTTQMWGSEMLASPARMRADTKAAYASRAPGAMLQDLDVDRPIVWFDKEDWEALPPSPGSRPGFGLDGKWSTFHRRHPKSAGWMDFSDVGFSTDRRQALVHVWNGTSSLGGAGFFFLLEKRGGRWVIVEKTMTAVS